MESIVAHDEAVSGLSASTLTPVERIIYYERQLQRRDLYPEQWAALMNQETGALLWHFGGSQVWVSPQITSSEDWGQWCRQASFVCGAVKSLYHAGWSECHNGHSDSFWRGQQRWHDYLRQLWQTPEAEQRIKVARQHMNDLLSALRGLAWPLDWLRLSDADEAKKALEVRWVISRHLREDVIYALSIQSVQSDLHTVEERWTYIDLALDYTDDIMKSWRSIAGQLAHSLERQEEAAEGPA